MKRFLHYLLSALVGLLSMHSATAQKVANSLLWKISRPGQAQPSYLFGTMHLICEQDYIWTPAMKEHFAESRSLCLELNLDEPGLLSGAGLQMIDMSGRTLRDYFKNDADYAILTRYIEDSLHQNMILVERMKPVALYLMYTSGAIQAPCTTTVSYELKLADQAREQGKTLNGLETLEEQMEALETIPTDTIIAEMLQIAQGKSTDNSDLAKMTSAYRNQDLAQLNQMMQQAAAEGLDSKTLIDNRNKRWISRMGKMMAEQETFFAVGAGHIYGLVQLLRQNGYKVEAVK